MSRKFASPHTLDSGFPLQVPGLYVVVVTVVVDAVVVVVTVVVVSVVVVVVAVVEVLEAVVVVWVVVVVVVAGHTSHLIWLNNLCVYVGEVGVNKKYIEILQFNK